MTPQRIAIYELLKSRNSHPSAEALYDCIVTRYPTMSLATVYKTLKTLVTVGLVQEINTGEGNSRYDSNVEPHAHIMCLKCGKVEDIEKIDFFDINDKIKNYTNYKILFSKIYFYGTCPKCK